MELQKTGIIIVVECRLRFTQVLLIFHTTEYPLEITPNSLLVNLQISINIFNLYKSHWIILRFFNYPFGLHNWTLFSGYDKARRRYDILDKSLKSITIFLPLEYL